MQITTRASWSELLMADHEMTERVFDAFDRALAPAVPSPAVVADALEYFTGYVERCHSHKEEDHLFPLLEARGLSSDGGPLAVMLMEHRRSGEALAELKRLAREYIAGNRGALPELAACLQRLRRRAERSLL